MTPHRAPLVLRRVRVAAGSTRRWQEGVDDEVEADGGGGRIA